MKFLLPTLLLAAILVSGCASQKPPATYQTVPEASNVDPSLGHLATVTGAKVYEEKDEAKKSRKEKRREKKKTETLIVTPETGLQGKVMVYNQPGRFVVLNFPIGHMPQIGTVFFVYRNGLKTGEIKITGPQRDDSIVADLTAGDARPGDEVRDK